MVVFDMTSQSAYLQLVSAVEEDDVQLVKRLIDDGVDINANLDNDIGLLFSSLSSYCSN